MVYEREYALLIAWGVPEETTLTPALSLREREKSGTGSGLGKSGAGSGVGIGQLAGSLSCAVLVPSPLGRGLG